MAAAAADEDEAQAAAAAADEDEAQAASAEDLEAVGGVGNSVSEGDLAIRRRRGGGTDRQRRRPKQTMMKPMPRPPTTWKLYAADDSYGDQYCSPVDALGGRGSRYRDE